ncbi:fatty acid desaturase family protein [Cystobacter ferrugineus]|uniref:fatty acid desaturase family protein n=1 Tax=Cystobacter ferrugineus TaxID=83449 RepID=UPI001FE7C9E6|nr:fatty acid desaturase [Cystobacter ferrugineus]
MVELARVRSGQGAPSGVYPNGHAAGGGPAAGRGSRGQAVGRYLQTSRCPRRRSPRGSLLGTTGPGIPCVLQYSSRARSSRPPPRRACPSHRGPPACPAIAWNFVLLPALFLPLGTWAAFSALCNSLMAEILSNLHTFAVGGPNHTGEDLYRFDFAPKGKGERYVHQVIGTANYRTGGDLNDFLHLWLNYQIEHHIFPDLSMLQYQRVQPKVLALCQKYGIPYVQESVWTRLRKMVDVAVGKSSMRRLAPREAALAPGSLPDVM